MCLIDIVRGAFFHHRPIRRGLVGLFVLLIASLTQVVGQSKILLRGRVTDAKTTEPILFGNVQLLTATGQRPVGTQTDLDGAWVLTLPADSVGSTARVVTLRFSYVGYETETRSVTVAPGQKVVLVNVRLRTNARSLSEVTVRGQRERYRNRGNPAVTLIERVIKNKARNRQESFRSYQYNKYEKIEFDLSNVSQKFRNRRALRKFDFVFNHLDTSEVTGRANLPIYLKESVSDVYFRQNPARKREVVEGEKLTSLGGYVDNNGIKLYIDALFQEVNIYDGNIMLLAQQFMGPTNPLAPQFYKYAIIDTVDYQGIKVINLGFSPRNKIDLLFQGTMAIALDSSYAIRRVEMGFAQDINVNFVTDLRIAQEYDFHGTDGLVLMTDKLAIEFNLLKKENGMGLFGQRSVSYRDYVLNQSIADERLAGPSSDIRREAPARPDSFWTAARHQPLSRKELGIYTMIDSVRSVPLFQKTVNTALFLLEGFKQFGPVELGPVNTFYSFNPVEGFRLRAGGRTTNALSERYAAEGYAAYGFRDQRWKYFAAATLSLTDHNIYTYPIKHLRLSYQHEIKIPGQELQFVQEDNFLLSFKRGVNNRYTYNRVFQLDYLNESRTGLTLNLNAKQINQAPAGVLTFDRFTPEGTLDPVPDITSTELTVGLRYAPHEQFYQGKNYRVPIVNQYPIFQVRYTAGVRSNLLGGQYNFHRLMGYANKRFFIVPIGFTDITAEGGITLGQVPYPLLTIHRANQTYAYQPEAFNMMNFMEFISDHYGSVFVDHHFNGAIFNKIPLLRQLKLREILTFKALVGGVRAENQPSTANLLTRFPVNPDGTPISYVLGREPYMEASLGIGNIFKILRLDFIKRLSYLDHPGAPTGFGLRFRVKVEF
jgi:Family of unknown function (DUF5686)/CarboxypepD_reg-like domain